MKRDRPQTVLPARTEKVGLQGVRDVGRKGLRYQWNCFCRTWCSKGQAYQLTVGLLEGRQSKGPETPTRWSGGAVLAGMEAVDHFLTATVAKSQVITWQG